MFMKMSKNDLHIHNSISILTEQNASATCMVSKLISLDTSYQLKLFSQLKKELVFFSKPGVTKVKI